MRSTGHKAVSEASASWGLSASHRQYALRDRASNIGRFRSRFTACGIPLDRQIKSAAFQFDIPNQVLNETIALIAKWTAALLTAGGGGAVAAYGVFNQFGKKWLDQHFKKNLEELKHAQQQEIELLRHQINSLFSRVSKIHEKEFEILPKAWLMLNELHGSVILALDLTMKYYPDFTGMPDAQLEEYLGTCRLSEHQKGTLRKTEASKRSDYFSEAMGGIYLDDANEKLRIFKNYLIEYSIFMTEELRERFNAAHKVFSDATINYTVRKASQELGNGEIRSKSVDRRNPQEDDH